MKLSTKNIIWATYEPNCSTSLVGILDEVLDTDLWANFGQDYETFSIFRVDVEKYFLRISYNHHWDREGLAMNILSQLLL